MKEEARCQIVPTTIESEKVLLEKDILSQKEADDIIKKTNLLEELRQLDLSKIKNLLKTRDLFELKDYINHSINIRYAFVFFSESNLVISTKVLLHYQYNEEGETIKPKELKYVVEQYNMFAADLEELFLSDDSEKFVQARKEKLGFS